MKHKIAEKLVIVMAAIGILLISFSQGKNILLIGLAVACIAVMAVLMIFFVRCPYCGEKLGRIGAEVCPACGKSLKEDSAKK